MIISATKISARLSNSRVQALIDEFGAKKINILVRNPMQIGAAVRWDLPTGSNPGVVVTCGLRLLMVISLARGGFSQVFFRISTLLRNITEFQFSSQRKQEQP